MKPDLVLKCIDSWKKFLPDYEIKEWNERNFDINTINFTKEAYSMGMWAFVSDYVRLWALYNEGGVYLDSDQEILKSLDKFLVYKGFIGFSPASPVKELSGAVIGACRENMWIKMLLDYYRNSHFISDDKKMDTETNASIMTRLSEKMIEFNNIQQTMNLGKIEIFPREYFDPINPILGTDFFSESLSYGIQWHACNWSDKSIRYRIKRNIFLTMAFFRNFWGK
ncbi:glycosyltransferase family 32 protein [Pectinatus frisingensis]|nr:glycosyltransferase [Pectinatus frisingensis]